MMHKLALRNIFRHRARAAMTLAAIIAGVVGLILTGGFVADIFDKLGEAIIHSQSGHIQIARNGFFDQGSRQPEKYLVADPTAIAQRVAAVDGVDDVMSRLNFSGLLNNGRSDLSIVGEGIEAEREARFGTYLRVKAGRQLTAADRHGILIGEGVARSLRLAVGDRATLLVGTPSGAMNTLEFEIAGIFQSFSKDYDDRAVKIPLVAAQELLDTKGSNVLVVTLRQTAATARVARALASLLPGEGLEARPWQVLNDFYSKTIELYDRQLLVLRLIVLLMVLLSVTSTVNMTIYERTGEIGTMRAIGNRNSQIFSLLMVESTLLGLLGSAIGVVLGIGLARLISMIGIPMPPPPNANIGYTAQILLLPSSLLGAFLVGATATVAACILPALRAVRFPVVDALRQNT